MPPTAGKRKRAAKPRLPSNPDDDVAMERYHERLRKYEDEQDEAVAEAASVAKKRLAGNEGDGASGEVDQLAAAVAQICRNLDDGFCPYAVCNAYVFVSSADESKFRKKGTVRVLITTPKGRRQETPDYNKLYQICGGSKSMYADEEDNLLLRFSHKKNCSAAVGPMVDLAVQKGMVKNGEEADRLKGKFKVWFDGVGWAKTRISVTNRPSSASWNGFPWDSYNILDNRRCGLARGLGKEWKALEIMCDAEPEDLVPAEMLPCFAKVWAANDGVVEDIPGAVAQAVQGCKAAMKK